MSSKAKEPNVFEKMKARRPTAPLPAIDLNNKKNEKTNKKMENIHETFYVWKLTTLLFVFCVILVAYLQINAQIVAIDTEISILTDQVVAAKGAFGVATFDLMGELGNQEDITKQFVVRPAAQPNPIAYDLFCAVSGRTTCRKTFTPSPAHLSHMSFIWMSALALVPHACMLLCGIGNEKENPTANA